MGGVADTYPSKPPYTSGSIDTRINNAESPSPAGLVHTGLRCDRHVFLLSSVATTLRTMWQIVQLLLFMSAGLIGNEAKSVPLPYRK